MHPQNTLIWVCQYIFLTYLVTNPGSSRYIGVMSDKNLLYTFTQGRARLLTMAQRLLHSDRDAEDALQEAFCRLWQRSSSLQTQADADKVAMTVVRNVSIDSLRHTQRHQLATLTDLEDQTNDAADNLLHERFKVVEGLINASLTPMQQRIVMLHDMEGASYEDISSREQMTEAAVRQQLSRARKKIRELYYAQREDKQ